MSKWKLGAHCHNQYYNVAEKDTEEPIAAMVDRIDAEEFITVHNADVDAYETKIADLQRWKDAVIDEAVISWVDISEQMDDPRMALKRLIISACQLDGALLKEQIADLQARLDAVVKLLESETDKVFAHIVHDAKFSEALRARRAVRALVTRAVAIAEGKS